MNFNTSITNLFSKFNRKTFRSKVWKIYLQIFSRPPLELYNTPGYLHEIEGRFLFWLAQKVPPQGLVVEVGSFKGRFSCFIAAGLKSDARLACIDTWEKDAMPYDSRSDVFQNFLENTRKYRDCKKME